MVIADLHDAFRKAIDAEIGKSADWIAAGKCASYEEYKSKCSRISGMKEALKTFTDVAKRHGEIDE